MPITKVYPEENIEEINLSKLEEIASGITEPITLLFMREKSDFGSFRSSAFSREVSRAIKEFSVDSFILPVIDGNSRYVQRPLIETKVEAIERRMNFNGPHIGKPLAILKYQLTSQEGRFISLSKGEDMIYHLQTTNNLNGLGFPGAWMLYYTPERGFYLNKVEPILIIPSCLVCPYGLIEELFQRGADMNLAEKRVIDELQRGGKKRRATRPSDCPNEDCELLFSHNNYGAVYRDRFFSFEEELDPLAHSLRIEKVPRGHPDGMKIAKIIGQLRNPFYLANQY